MKFKIRDGFVIKTVTKVDVGDGTFQMQENTSFSGQTVDLDATQAGDHAHKLEPMDKAAAAFLDAKVLPVSAAAAVGVTPEILALVKAMATEIAAQMLAVKPAPAAAA